MNRVILCCASLLLAACSGQTGAPSDADTGFRGELDLAQCSGVAPVGLLVRGSAEPAPGVVAAVCGTLEGRDTLTVNAGALAVSGDWVTSAPASVGGAAFVNGTLTAHNLVTIGGVLHTLTKDLSNVTAASVTTSGTAQDSPLACGQAPVSPDAMQRIEAGGVVDWGDALAAHSESANVVLGCARYRFSSWDIDNDLVLKIQASTVIVVDGNVRIAAPVRIELAPGAKLDFIVAGSLNVDNTLSLTGGSTWLGVGGNLRFAAPVTIEGSLFAPLSQVELDDTLNITGSLFVGPLRVAAPLIVTGVPSSEPTCGAAP